ncbi:MFS transporter [Salimicrobium humidisoli]|uniref:MFS transporter n=1 Tax=Salimicrobium humidisoli TaxID=2029857 RepID=A0ABX4HQV1_9BACI|nr:MFS transporter [Salimicrobium humidisoli]PBB05569.1 MFS transporter [Salimicrobium humidisoli]
MVQFVMLVIINLFVGSMVGLERTVLPMIGEERFGLLSTSAALSFIVSFGFSKALVNLFAGNLADRAGRKKVLLAGWGIGLFVPIMVIFAHAWWVIIVANIFLGVNQGLTWSMTVNMKVDLAKSTERGLAVGFNEFAGYLGLAVMASVSGYVASTYSLSPEPFYIGIVLVVLGFLLSLAVRNTEEHVKTQANEQEDVERVSGWEIFKRTSWKNPDLASGSFAGLTTNLKDGIAWGLFPIFLTTGGLSVAQTGTAMVYPTILASISDVAHPEWRATSMGIYRFFRDSGYAFGALIAGIIADLLSVTRAIGLVAFLPLLSGIIVWVKMKETLQDRT